MNDNDRLFLALMGIVAPKSPEPCTLTTLWHDGDLLIRRCNHGTTEVGIRPLGDGVIPGKMRRMAGMN